MHRSNLRPTSTQMKEILSVNGESNTHYLNSARTTADVDPPQHVENSIRHNTLRYISIFAL